MANKITFNTPPSSTGYDIETTGTIPGWAKGHAMVLLRVTGTNLARTATQQLFYTEKNYDNTATSTATHIVDVLHMAISPMVHAPEKITATVQFSHTGTILV